MRRFGLDNDDPATLETLAEEMGVTRERVRQIQQEALIKLKRAMAARGVVRDSFALTPVGPAVQGRHLLSYAPLAAPDLSPFSFKFQRGPVSWPTFTY